MLAEEVHKVRANAERSHEYYLKQLRAPAFDAVMQPGERKSAASCIIWRQALNKFPWLQFHALNVLATSCRGVSCTSWW
jgi:hypothetical protein